jgi:hypothetical protein
MPTGGHVHIISAGEKIHTAYPAIFRELPSISYTYVFADSEVYALSSSPGIEKHRLAVRHAVDAVKEISLSLSIPFDRKTVFAPVYPSVRTILTEIHRGHPGARFTFDLSGGSKPLCMALFAFAPWLAGEVWSAFDEGSPRNIPLPERSVRSLMANPNYQTILAVLIRNRKTGKGTGIPWVSRQYLYQQVWPYYTRSRAGSPGPEDPGEPLVHYRRGRKPAGNMSHATFSGFMGNLRNAGIIEEGQDEKNRKEKTYRITETGDAAFRFFSDPVTNTIVKTVLEGN